MYEDKKLLKRFLKENFNFTVLRKAGVFTKEMRYDYVSQANKICYMYGYKTVYEYGAEDFTCHITYTEDVALMNVGNDGELKSEPFITRHEGHEPDTFVKNQNGAVVYSAGHSSINLVAFFENLLSDYIEQTTEA